MASKGSSKVYCPIRMAAPPQGRRWPGVSPPRAQRYLYTAPHAGEPVPGVLPSILRPADDRDPLQPKRHASGFRNQCVRPACNTASERKRGTPATTCALPYGKPPWLRWAGPSAQVRGERPRRAPLGRAAPPPTGRPVPLAQGGWAGALPLCHALHSDRLVHLAKLYPCRILVALCLTMRDNRRGGTHRCVQH